MKWLLWLVGFKTWVDIRLIKIACYFYTINGERRKNSQKNNEILIIRLDHKIGDMVCFSDFLRQIRIIRPNANITLVIHSNIAELYKHCPYVNEQLYFDWGSSLPMSLVHRVRRVMEFVKCKVLYKPWSLAICSRFDEDYHAPFIAYSSGAVDRIGYASNVTKRKRRLMLGADALLMRVVPGGGVCHEVDRNRRLLLTAFDDQLIPMESPGVETWISNREVKVIDNALEAIGINSDDTIIAIGFGAYEPKRIWPSSRYSQLIQAMMSQSPWSQANYILIGAASEYLEGEGIRKYFQPDSKVYNFAGKTSINECSALLRRSKLFIGNDSGLLHLAAASGCWCLEISCHPSDGDISHSNSPIRFGPYTELRKILQPRSAVTPCSAYCQGQEAHCILEVSVSSVLDAILNIQFREMA